MIFIVLLLLLVAAEGIIINGTNRRVISIPDLHGNYECLMKILLGAQLISKTDYSWIGGNTAIIQLGDILDRGNDSPKILRYLANLQQNVTRTDGIVAILMGNHEWMNLQGDYRYAGLGEDFHPQTRCEALAGEFGSFIRSFPVVIKVEYIDDKGIVFVHGGLQHKFLRTHNPIEDLNIRFKAQEEKELFGMEGPLWNRFLARGSDIEAVCQDLEMTFKLIGVNKMVVGHTKQSQITSRCEGKLLLSDVEHCVGLEHFADGTYSEFT